MTRDNIKDADDKTGQLNAELEAEISAHAEYLSKSLPVCAFENAILTRLASRCESNCRKVMSQLFDNDCDFQEWISCVRDELCRRIAVEDIRSKYRDSD